MFSKWDLVIYIKKVFDTLIDIVATYSLVILSLLGKYINICLYQMLFGKFSEL